MEPKFDKTPAPASLTLSHTRVKQFENCPMAYRLRYVDRAPATSIGHMDLGVVVHRALELILLVAVQVDHRGRLDDDMVEDALQEAWSTAGAAVDQDSYDAARAMLLRFARDVGEFDSTRVFGIEFPFTLCYADFAVRGVIDRVDRLDDETVEITDYKTGELVPSADELRSNLQLSLYEVAARTLWPWVKRVKLTLHMVRHGIKLHTRSTAEDLKAALAYVKATGRRIVVATETGEFPARLSPSCGTCTYRLSCPAYGQLVKTLPTVGTTVPGSLDDAAWERERVNTIAKVAEARRKELDVVLRAAVDKRGEFTAGGRRYFTRNVARRSYSLPDTIGRVAEVSGMPAGEVVQRLARIDNGELMKLLKQLGETVRQADLDLLRAELEAAADRSYTTQLWSKPAPDAVLEIEL